MNHLTRISILFLCFGLIFSCTDEDKPTSELAPQATTGTISGNISPINVYDAEITVLRNGQIITVVEVEDGIFDIEQLPPGNYDLRVSALGYVTNNAIKNVQVLAGQTTEVGRAIIYPEDAGGYVPTRLTGTVFDAEAGSPISDALIAIECNEGICGTIEGISNLDGEFEVAIWANLASVVTIEKAGYRTARVEVFGIPTSTAKSIAVRLERLGD